MYVELFSYVFINLKEFGVYYLMIVVGIFIVFGLEVGFEVLYYWWLVCYIVEQVEIELQVNFVEVCILLIQNCVGLDWVQGFYVEVKKFVEYYEVKFGVLKDLLCEKLCIGVVMLSLWCDVWDMVVVDQVLVYLLYDDLCCLFEVYIGQWEVQQVIQISFGVIGFFVWLIDVVVDVEFGWGDLIDLLKVLQVYWLMFNVVVGVEEDLEKQLVQLLGCSVVEFVVVVFVVIGY